jgi:hypothetical protein
MRTGWSMHLHGRLLLLLSVLFAIPVLAQTRHAVYGELGGAGILPTFNYERRLTDRVAARIGAGFIVGEDSDGEEDFTMVFPLAASYISHPQANHHFEAGGGILFVVGDAQDFGPGDDEEEKISNVGISGLLGYRYQRPERSFVFRTGVTPFYYDGEAFPFIGLSFGWAW